MRTVACLLLIVWLFLSGISCNKITEYFNDPETNQLVETVQSTVMAGYAANVAFSVMQGMTFPNVTSSRSNAGFPCTSLTVIHTENDNTLFLSHSKATTITVAALWADETTAVMSLVMTAYHSSTATIDLLGIKTIPVIRTGDHINLALASMDIQLNPDQDALLQLNLNTLEIESELFRLETPRPADVYVAVLQDAYFIDVYNNLTGNTISDDTYTITGGGQLVKVAGSSAEITQQALVEVEVSPACQLNPIDGMALMKVTGVKDEGFPELGTAVFDFRPTCDGTAHIYAATGKYIGSNGRSVRFHL
jgi:hypothetical protein